MNVTPKITLLIVAIVVVVTGLLLLLGNGLCQTTVYATNVSPDGKYKVVHQMADCGATTNFNTTALLYRSSFPFFPSSILGLDGKYTDKEVAINWESNSKLRVDFTGRSTDIRKIAFHARGIEIEIYENGNKLTPQHVGDIEAAIVKEQATYKISLPEGSHWIEVSQ